MTQENIVKPNISRRELLQTGATAAALIAAGAVLVACGDNSSPAATAPTSTSAPAVAATDVAAPAMTDTTAPVAAADTAVATIAGEDAATATASNIESVPTNTAVTEAAADTPAASSGGGGTVIAKVADLAPGAGTTFKQSDGDDAVLVRLSDGSFLAYSAICTHKSCTVGYKKGDTLFRCPCHGSQFTVADGSVAKGPANGPLKKLTIRVDEASGDIFYES